MLAATPQTRAAAAARCSDLPARVHPPLPQAVHARTVRIRVLSDLHLEFADFEPPGLDADVVVLAGDIAPGTSGLEWAARHFDDTPVVYVAGNHEFYGEDLRETHERLRQAANALGIHLLENTAVTLAGVRFLGTTLWTDFGLFGPGQEYFARDAAHRSMRDYAAIRLDGRALHPADTAARHAAACQWLARELAKPCRGPRVVVTHHLPSMRSVASHYRHSLLSAAFASNCDALLARADAWLHGHTHDACDYRFDRCRVLCNPRGYPGERGTGFDATRMLELAW